MSGGDRRRLRTRETCRARPALAIESPERLRVPEALSRPPARLMVTYRVDVIDPQTGQVLRMLFTP